MNVAPQTSLVDVEHLGRAGAIGAYLLESESGVAVVDPGPASALPNLLRKLGEQGMSVADIHTVLLTHIHLDHAGAAGTLVTRNPRIRVYVHERGARHMIDPSRLLESARRLYGAEMDHLWGEFLAVPTENVQALVGGEHILVGDRKLEVVYTPGHAWHHVSYFDAARGLAFTGDTTGLRISNQPHVMPVTPPPDIDLEAWRASLAQIRDRRPERLCLTHFGPGLDAEWHLAQLEEELAHWGECARQSLALPEPDEEKARLFAEQIRAGYRRRLPSSEIARLELTGGIEQGWYGLARYWRKRAGK